ncbi:hypothetical protein [Abyssisolibacter fermentans]|uniref:hypothetical protein n=1 Tax=Abyssisolibacter fermentans TaxID=1766203 RepID=UPI00082D4F1A|nr:hypothetical protein [Abyssisolibacter fermentans]
MSNKQLSKHEIFEILECIKGGESNIKDLYNFYGATCTVKKVDDVNGNRTYRITSRNTKVIIEYSIINEASGELWAWIVKKGKKMDKQLGINK